MNVELEGRSVIYSVAVSDIIREWDEEINDILTLRKPLLKFARQQSNL